VTRAQAAEQRAIEREAAELRKAGGVFKPYTPPCHPYVELPEPRNWLPCWKRVFGITQRSK